MIYTYHQENPNNEHDSSGDSEESKKTTKKRKSDKITFDDIAGLDEAKNAFNEKSSHALAASRDLRQIW